MTEQRIILANSSQLVHDMLNRILFNTKNLEVVQEVANHEKLPSEIDKVDAEWIVMSMPVDKEIPEWVRTYIIDHPSTRIMTVANDRNLVKTKWLDNHEEEFVNLSLKDLIQILKGVKEPA
jgi:DNA-binding NarL/FixJ family response regulator